VIKQRNFLFNGNTVDKMAQGEYHWKLYHEIENHSVIRSLYELGCWAWVKGTGRGLDIRKI
jgi:hypothetical protein